jgi:hypothetical protein
LLRYFLSVTDDSSTFSDRRCLAMLSNLYSSLYKLEIVLHLLGLEA